MSRGDSNFIRESEIFRTLEASRNPDAARVREILEKAEGLSGLSPEDVAALSTLSDPELLSEMFYAARRIKDTIYGKRLVIFAPLYVSNLCGNECSYCAFRAKNKEVHRRALTQAEIAEETEYLVERGHKRVLLVAGESYPKEGFDYILKSIDTIYSVKSGKGEIRRINVNIAPLEVDEFRRLKAARIGTYQLFQETYHRETYASVHTGGPKADYDWRIGAIGRAMEAGIDDAGIGVLFGLFDWRYEILALMQHAAHLEKIYGAGPHTISVPRLEPAAGSALSEHPPKPVGDLDFRKIVAILRLAVPYTGIIMSTRETPKIRRETFALGVSQISAGSRTNPGGYSHPETGDLHERAGGQFSLGDHRALDDVVKDVCELGFIPSFCTACYRLGRTGADFMDLAKPGDIKMHCDPNALATLEEYLLDYASPETQAVGRAAIEKAISEMQPAAQKRAVAMLGIVRAGRRDVFC